MVKDRHLMMYGVKLEDDDFEKIEAECMDDRAEFNDILDNWIIASSDTFPEFYFGIMIYATEYSTEKDDRTIIYNRPTVRTLLEAKEYIDSFGLDKKIGYHFLTQLSI